MQLQDTSANYQMCRQYVFVSLSSVLLYHSIIELPSIAMPEHVLHSNVLSIVVVENFTFTVCQNTESQHIRLKLTQT